MAGSSSLFLYSTNPWVKLHVQRHFRGDLHYVWCGEHADSRVAAAGTLAALTPPSSNPAEIYADLRQAVARTDTHNAKVRDVRDSYLGLTPRGVPLNVDAVQVLREQIGRHPRFCFTYEGQPLRADVTNTAWHSALKRAGIKDFRFHDLRHTWASWHRQAGTSCDELKDLGGWKSRQMVDRYAKFATENLLSAASRIERGEGRNVTELSRSSHG
jgi:hypothetical protein